MCEVRRECVECELLNAHTPHEQQSAAKRQATTGAAADADAAAASSLQLIDNSDVMRRVTVMRLHGKLPAIRQRATRTHKATASWDDAEEHTNTHTRTAAIKCSN